MTTLENYEIVKPTKVSICENCGRTELVDIRLTPSLFKTLHGNVSYERAYHGF